MRSRSLLFLFILFLPVCAFSQQGGGYQRGGGGRGNFEPSALTVFSENGEQFFLILNGVNQNNMPQSRIRVEGLPKYGNDIQVVFANSRAAAIRKTVNIADPVDGKAVNMTLKIVRGRDGMARLKFHKCTEVDRGYRPERGEFMMNYGVPKEITTVTETTYVDPYNQQVVTQTTTTTTNDNNYNYNTPPPPPRPMPMDNRTFSDAKQAISNSSFDNTRLSTAKTVLASNFVTTDQVMELCQLFSFDDSKLNFAKYAFDRTVDANNYFKVSSVFSFDASKQSLNDYISRRR